MIIEQKLITPEIAADMLTRNIGNRPLRPKVWRSYAADMKSGNWRKTHEAIAVSASGRLLNGQHRLTAVVHSGVAQTFWVAVYDTQEVAMDLPIDYGARRSLADILNEDKLSVQTASALYRTAITRRQQDPRPNEAQYILSKAGSAIQAAVAVSRGRERLKASALARAAIVTNILLYEQDKEAIVESYRRWVVGENAIWPSVEALNKQLPSMDNKFTNNTFCRVAFAFNPENREARVVRMNAMQEAELLENLTAKLASVFPEMSAQ